jgi:hypothetical protein
MTQLRITPDLAILALAVTFGWSAHSCELTTRRTITRAYDAGVERLVSNLPEVHGSVVVTAHSIQITLLPLERTA